MTFPFLDAFQVFWLVSLGFRCVRQWNKSTGENPSKGWIKRAPTSSCVPAPAVYAHTITVPVASSLSLVFVRC
jgi:hypothetical protein